MAQYEWRYILWLKALNVCATACMSSAWCIGHVIVKPQSYGTCYCVGVGANFIFIMQKIQRILI